jgi:hypothetical protein
MLDTDCALDEFSPYEATFPNGWVRWTWRDVLAVITRAHSERRLMPELPHGVQGRGALVGLSVGLGFRQLALSYEARRVEELRALYCA